MTTPIEAIIAGVLAEHQPAGPPFPDLRPRCTCGNWVGSELAMYTERTAHQAAAVLAALDGQVPLPSNRVLDTDAQLQAAPDKIIVQAADGTVAARYDAERGVVFGDNRPFPWSALRAPAVVLREAM